MRHAKWTYSEVKEIGEMLKKVEAKEMRWADIISHFLAKGKKKSSIKMYIHKVRKHGVPEGPDGAYVHFNMKKSWDVVHEIRAKYATGLYTLEQLKQTYGFDVRNVIYNKSFRTE